MAYDISAAIERYIEPLKEWRAVMRPNKWHGIIEDTPPVTAKLDIDRDYRLFAILADVRNEFGFRPISSERGLPGDISDEAMDACGDESYASWVTLEEILLFDWRQVATLTGFVDAATFEEWERLNSYGCRREPREWGASVYGASVKVVSNEEMRAAVLGHAETQERETLKSLDLYTRVSWQKNYAECTPRLWTSILPEMLACLTGRTWADMDPKSVRLVMNFDS